MFHVEQPVSSFPLPPRDVFRRKGIPVPLRIALFILIPHVWVGLFLIGVFFLRPAVGLFGYERDATVVSRESVHGKHSTRCRIGYEYKESGLRYVDHDTVEQNAARQFPTGTTLRIKSLHLLGLGGSTPWTGRRPAASSLIPLAMPLFWNGIVFWLFCAICLAPLRHRRLVKIGEAVNGRITAKTIQRNKSTTYSVVFEYPTPDGIRSAKMAVAKADYDLAAIGDDAVVLYDPARPSWAILYKYIQYSARDGYGYAVHA